MLLPPNPFRPRSFAASPHAVIFEGREESRGATPLEDDTGGGKEGKREEGKRNVGEDIILPQNNRPPKPIRLSKANDFYDSVGVGAHDDPCEQPPSETNPSVDGKRITLNPCRDRRPRRSKNPRQPTPIGLSKMLQRMVRTVEDACPYKC